MDHEIHYYVNFLIAKQAGFSNNEAYTIAYSAQYIDDNDTIYHIKPYDNINNKYTNYITQTCDLTLPKKILMKIYTVFHFVPEILFNKIICNSRKRFDKKYNLFNTVAGGNLVRKLLRKALYNNNMYEIGIASHAFMDSWAHQNFTGMFSDFNVVIPPIVSINESNIKSNAASIIIKKCTCCQYIYNNLNNISGKVGHIDALHMPDMLCNKWPDYRLKDVEVNNNNRFIDAIKNILYEYITFKNNNNFNYNNRYILQYNYCNTNYFNTYNDTKNNHCTINNTKFIKEITYIFNIKCKRKRMKMYNALCKKLYGLSYIIPYDKNKWLQDSIELKHNVCYFWKNINFTKTDWYLFQEEVKKYQYNVMHYLKLMVQSYGVNF